MAAYAASAAESEEMQFLADKYNMSTEVERAFINIKTKAGNVSIARERDVVPLISVLETTVDGAGGAGGDMS